MVCLHFLLSKGNINLTFEFFRLDHPAPRFPLRRVSRPAAHQALRFPPHLAHHDVRLEYRLLVAGLHGQQDGLLPVPCLDRPL